MSVELSDSQASAIISSLSGSSPGVFVTFDLIKKAGGLDKAAFLSQSAWLSANANAGDGWFFLEQEGMGIANHGLFKVLGSWENALGIPKKRHEIIRRELINAGHLAELPSFSAKKRGEKPLGNCDTAFIFTQKRGTPPRLHYRVDLAKYLGKR